MIVQKLFLFLLSNTMLMASAQQIFQMPKKCGQSSKQF